jgi:hypothetical protein
MDKDPSIKELSLQQVERAKEGVKGGLATGVGAVRGFFTMIVCFFLPEYSPYQGFPRLILFIGLASLVVAVPAALNGLTKMLLFVPAVALPAIVLGALWKHSWMAFIGLLLACLSFVECAGAVIYFRYQRQLEAGRMREELIDRVEQLKVKVDAEKRAVEEAAAEKARAEAAKIATEEAARKAEEQRIAQEFRRKLEAEEAQKEAERRKREQAELEAKTKREEEEKKKREDEAARVAREEKRQADLEVAREVYREKSIKAEDEHSALTKLENSIRIAKETMEKHQARLEQLETDAGAAAEIERVRQLYQTWKAEFDKAQAALPAATAASAAAQKQKDEASKVLDALNK